MSTLWKSVIVVLLVGAPTLASEPPTTSTWESRGDHAWTQRAEGFRASGIVAPGPANAAVEAYERALVANPNDLELRFKLIEALYFQGHFVTQRKKDRKRIFQHQVELVEQTLDLIHAQAAGNDALESLSIEGRAARLRDVPHAARGHFWAAISWGLWGMSHGYTASAARGVAHRIRDHAQLLALIDENYADAGGLRILGRLHTATPRIILFTGWIDRREGLESLRRANAISSRDPRNPLFLAEAILRHDPANRAQATALLRELVQRAPAPDYIVEETETLDTARELLAGLERK